MKKYIKPRIEETAFDTKCQLMAASDVYNEPSTGPQLASGKKGDYIPEEEEENYGW